MDTSKLFVTLAKFTSQLAAERTGQISTHLTVGEPISYRDAVAQNVQIRDLQATTLVGLQSAADSTFGSGVWEVVGGMELDVDFQALGYDKVQSPLTQHQLHAYIWAERGCEDNTYIWRIHSVVTSHGAVRESRRDLTFSPVEDDVYLSYRDALSKFAS